jgi:PST family polysaccharide transporter
MEARELGRRLRITIMLHGGLGLLGFLAFWLIGPWLTALLFGATVAIDTVTALGFGVATLGISLGTAFGRIGLITLDARKTFMVCVLIASALGVGALLVGGGLGGAAGAAWGLGLAELFSGALQGALLLARWRGRPAPMPPVS